MLPVIGNDSALWVKKYGKVALGGRPGNFELYSKFHDKWFSVLAYSPEKGKFATIFEDITPRKKAENDIKKSLKEKEVLLRELYHRTKNNMQVISSIVRLRARLVKHIHTKEILKEIENKIIAMALVHQKLYESEDLSKLNLKDYFTSLISLIKNTYGSNDKDFEIKLNCVDLDVLIDTAAPLGLVINELISNSMKHAFPNQLSLIHISEPTRPY